jgi:hypothetical protein
VSVFFADHVNGASGGSLPLGGTRDCPKRIEALLAAADVTVPSYGTIPIGKVDAALKGIDNVQERLRIKSQLRQLGLID